MNANELRIGNKVYDNGKICTIESINAFADGEADVYLVETGNAGMYIDPIHLTEDILLKCGFEYRNENRGLGAILDFKNKEFDNWKYDMSVAFQHETDNKEIVYLHFLQHKTTNSIKYLHQLQNLYFALTQEELTIKL